jgi:hypothetical protein
MDSDGIEEEHEQRSAFADEARILLARTSPDCDLRALAVRGWELGLLSHTEVDQLGLYAQFPAWLNSRLEAGLNIREITVEPSKLIDAQSCNLSAPAGDFSLGSILTEFTAGQGTSPPVLRFDGGASVHHVANFRKLSWSSKGLIAPLSNINARVLLPYLQSASPVSLEGRTLLAVVEGSSVFTHWILDTLPRLLLVLDQEGSLDGYDRILLATDRARFHPFTLSALGIEPSRVITRQHHGSLFATESFTHVTAPRHQFVAHARIYDMVTAFFVTDMAPVRQTRRLYISRNKASRRRIMNEQEMHAALHSRGFEMIHLEDMTIAESARMFRSASHIVAPHGAGLSNLIFCQPGTRVLEIHSAHLSREYWVIANQRGLDYFGLEACDPQGLTLTRSARAAMGFFHRNGLDIYVPMDRLRSMMDGHFLR